MVLNERLFANFAQNWLPWQRPLRNRKKVVRIDNIHTDTFHLVTKIVKIGPVDPEIGLLNLKKETESKIYSPVGNFAERAKLTQAKYIAQSASVPSGLNQETFLAL